MSNLYVGDIVKLDQEYGLVLEVPEVDENGKYVSGHLLVRWDTEKENDVEDCLGNLEGLLVKVESVNFQYIDSSGSLKKV